MITLTETHIFGVTQHLQVPPDFAPASTVFPGKVFGMLGPTVWHGFRGHGARRGPTRVPPAVLGAPTRYHTTHVVRHRTSRLLCDNYRYFIIIIIAVPV